MTNFCRAVLSLADSFGVSARELAEIRRTRFVVKHPELPDTEMNTMAALVGDRDGSVLGTLSVSAPGDSFRRAFKSAAPALRTAADQLSAAIAAQPQP